MDIEQLKKHSEAIAAKVHDAWWDEKKNQGFHAPVNCTSANAQAAWKQDEKSLGHNAFPKFYKFCDKCHADMYPYEDLPENVKDYDRVTAATVLNAISEMYERYEI